MMTVDKIMCIVCRKMNNIGVPKLLPGEYPSPFLNAANIFGKRKPSTKTMTTKQSPKFEDARSASPKILSRSSRIKSDKGGCGCKKARGGATKPKSKSPTKTNKKRTKKNK
jgi:hypothetical protein